MSNLAHLSRRAQRGFTLVEAIVVIVLTGIVAGMVAMFIRLPVQSYLATEARAELSDTADLALRRMSRELRLALPYTVTPYNGRQAVQFLLTSGGARYISVNDNPPATLLPLDFIGAKAQFDLVGTPPAGKGAIVAGNYIVTDNRGSGTADAYAFGTATNISRVAAIAGSRITLQQNYFKEPEPAQPIFQVVVGTVTYLCTPGANGTGTLQRYFTTGIVKGIGNLGALGTPALLADTVAGCVFDNTLLPGQNAGTLLSMVLSLQHASGERAQLVRQTQLDNP